MKKIYFIIFVSLAPLLRSNSANATVHTVTCQNGTYHYLPVTVNAVVGDTIHWTWVSGTHVVGPIDSTDIPTGAAMWNCPIDASHLSCEYVLTVAGTYNYVCHPAFPHGENADMVVTSPAGVQQYNIGSNVFSVYPNPCSDKITIETPNAGNISVYNMLGQKIKSMAVKNGQTKVEMDVAELTKGVYFIQLSQGEKNYSSKVIVK